MFQGFSVAWYSKLMATLIGFRVSREELRRNAFLYPIEVVAASGSGHRRFRFSFDAEMDREREVNLLLSSFNADANVMVWATPALPMLLFVLIALIISITAGDVVMGVIFNIIAHVSV